MGYIRQCRILQKVICLANELDLGNLHGHGRTSVSYCWENKPVKTEGLIIWKMNLLGANTLYLDMLERYLPGRTLSPSGFGISGQAVGCSTTDLGDSGPRRKDNRAKAPLVDGLAGVKRIQCENHAILARPEQATHLVIQIRRFWWVK